MNGPVRAADVPLATALDDATNTLAAAGVPTPRWDAEHLAAHVLGLRRSALRSVELLSPAADAELRKFIEARASRIPLQHLVGRVGFRRIELSVGPGVFVPRPETEVVAGAAVERLQVLRREDPIVVDLCTGSAAIALALANELPHLNVHAVDSDELALRWAARNVEERHAAGDRFVTLHHAEARYALPEFDGIVDLVVSNPPYLTLSDLDAVEPEVRDHDPRAALVSGVDGLDVIRDVVLTAARLLRDNGDLVLEHSDTQDVAVPAILERDGRWVEIADHRDMAGRPRFTTARRAAR